MRALMLSAPWVEAHPADIERVTAWLTTTTGSALAAELDALAASRDLRPELAALRCPVYARVGDLDAGCPPSWSQDLVRCVPRGELELVHGVGHALMIEDVAGTVAAVRARVLAAGAARG
jgi:3-oxoadipate enol-lactonase